MAVGIDEMWRLVRMQLGTESLFLGLDIRRWYSLLHMLNLQEMFQFPKVSVLELCLDTRGLRIWNAIQKLKLVLDWDVMMDEECLPNCTCDEPQNWRSQNISLMGLEEVEIENFRGSVPEVDLLKLLFRCAPLTKVTVKLASKVKPCSSGCKGAYKIFKANPATKCSVYLKRGNEVIYSKSSWR